MLERDVVVGAAARVRRLFGEGRRRGGGAPRGRALGAAHELHALGDDFGSSFSTVPPMATRGVYRSTNATSAAGSMTFQKLVVTTDSSVDTQGTGNVSIS